jgi:hypothetical protein
MCRKFVVSLASITMHPDSDETYWDEEEDEFGWDEEEFA